MQSIINIEDRLRVIKTLFEISVEAKVYPEEIFIYTAYQKWNPSTNFRAECMYLSFDNPSHKKTIEILYSLCNDIISLFDKLRQYLGEIEREYKFLIECKPYSNNFFQLDLVRRKIESEIQDEFHFIDGEWYPYKRSRNDENSEFIMTSTLFLVYFVLTIQQFLKERILIGKPESNSISLQNNGNSNYTTKSIIMACYYACKKDYYIIPELEKNPLILTNVYKKLASSFGLSYKSFSKDWRKMERKNYRISKYMSENIKKAIKLLESYKDPKIDEAIVLARQELNESELNK